MEQAVRVRKVGAGGQPYGGTLKWDELRGETGESIQRAIREQYERGDVQGRVDVGGRGYVWHSDHSTPAA